MLFSIGLIISIFVGHSVAVSSTIPSTASNTLTTITTAPPTIITPYPLSKDNHFTNADACVQSCASFASNLWSSKLSCSGENPATCVCQSWGLVAASAHNCAALSCTVPISASGDYEGAGAKMAIFGHCDSNGLITNSQTTILPSLVSGRFTVSPKIQIYGS